MKKALFGTSAIAGAAVLAAGSAFAGEAPQVTFSGAVAYELQFNDGGREPNGSGARISGNEQMSEFVWDARGTADNGLDYGANVQWRWMNAGGGNFDESYVDVRGSFGRVYLGGEDGVTDLVAGSSGHSVQAGTWGTDGNGGIRNVNLIHTETALMYYNSALGMTSDANKIGYITPNFGGFQAGISFTPDASAQQVTGGTENTAKSNVVDVAAGWGGEIAGVGVKVDAGYQSGSVESAGPTPAATLNAAGTITAGTNTSGTEAEDIGSYQIGGTLSFAGFGFGVGYVDNDDSGCNQLTAGCDAGSAVNVGVSYNFGAGTISAMYQNAEQNLDGDQLIDRAEITHVGATVSVAEGMSVYGSYLYFDVEDDLDAVQPVNGGGDAGEGNHAHVFIIGTRVTF